MCVVSGGNQDISRYGEVAERALISEGRKHYFIVEFPQEPGALRRFLDEVLGPDDDITLFEYVKRTSKEFGPALVGIELGDPADLPRLMASLESLRGARDQDPAERGRLPVSGLSCLLAHRALSRRRRHSGFADPLKSVVIALDRTPVRSRRRAIPTLADLRANPPCGEAE